MVNSSTSKLIAAFILLIIGIILAGQVAVIGSGVTSKMGIANEVVDYTTAFQESSDQINETITFTVANNPTSWKVDDCPLTEVVLTNSSGSVWTSGTDYTFTASTGTFIIKNTIDTNVTDDNYTYIDYTYCDDDYMNLTWGRTGINLVPGFFAITMLLISVGLFYSVAKENRLIK